MSKRFKTNNYFKTTSTMNTSTPTNNPNHNPNATTPDNVEATKVANLHKGDFKNYLKMVTEYLDTVHHPTSNTDEAATWKRWKIQGFNKNPSWATLCKIVHNNPKTTPAPPHTSVQSIASTIERNLPSLRDKFHLYSPCPHATNFTIEIYDVDPTATPTDLPTYPRTKIPTDLARKAPAAYTVRTHKPATPRQTRATEPKAKLAPTSILNYTTKNNQTNESLNQSTDSSIPEFIKTEKWETVGSPHTQPKQLQSPTKTPTPTTNHWVGNLSVTKCQVER
jgi:hypothetical protein